MQYRIHLFVLMTAALLSGVVGVTKIHAAVAGKSGNKDLTIAAGGKTDAIIVVSAEAESGPKGVGGPNTFERFAADELARCIELMTGARPTIADTPDAIEAALKEKRRPVLLVGTEALKAKPRLMKRLKKVAKKDPILRADAIVVERNGNRVYLSALAPDGYVHAVVELLYRWGCRWYVPTEFGECIPRHEALTVGKLDYAYASPFELRSYWISWNGSQKGNVPFLLHNRMTSGLTFPVAGHYFNLAIKEIIPEGKSGFNVPVADEKTINHVAKKIEEQFRDGKDIRLGMSDGMYDSDSELDMELKAGFYDKYFMLPSMTDNFMTFYNGVCEVLLKKYPDSKARIGFLAYSNISIPPQRIEKVASPMYCTLAPIDIDPNHGMDDPRSPPRQEFREMMYRWTEVMDGRVAIYDYDQGALVWRDIPNPCHQAFRQDVKHYARAGVVGFKTESRLAIATVFLNLYLRGQLMWNPEADVDALLDEFYPIFYGPAAEPMRRYWSAIYKAWEDTIVTEHEFFMAPAIYTPALMKSLVVDMQAAEKAVVPLVQKKNKSGNEKLYLERMRFTRLGFDVLNGYMTMIFAGATEGRYGDANMAGKQALAARKELAEMNPTFTTRVVGVAKEPEYGGSPAWFPGEVKFYGDLRELTDGTKGTLVQMLPLEWAFRRDPNDTGLASGWAYQDKIDLSFWKKNQMRFPLDKRKDYPLTEWEMLRTDLYAQAQGVLHPDGQAFTGHSWFRTEIDMAKRDATKPVHLRFPGLFAEAWLYVNGRLVAYRPQKSMWWHNSYAFDWDVDLAKKLKPGRNILVVRNYNKHHVSGMFRRPFLYRPKATVAKK